MSLLFVHFLFNPIQKRLTYPSPHFRERSSWGRANRAGSVEPDKTGRTGNRPVLQECKRKTLFVSVARSLLLEQPRSEHLCFISGSEESNPPPPVSEPTNPSQPIVRRSIQKNPPIKKDSIALSSLREKKKRR